VVAWAAILGCAYLFVSLPWITKVTFVIWNVLGIVVYFLYARHQSALARA
jgi:APA family basic amino acid/polyamine antiporter